MLMSSSNQADQINFWNGNKSSARQSYELELLDLILQTNQKEFGAYEIINDMRNYPTYEGEANVLKNGSDVLVTIAGNVKFSNKNKIIIRNDLTKGLLGYRLLIIRDNDKESFANIKQAQQLQKLAIGIPDSWLDAALFRHNNYNVIEKGSFEALFNLLKNKTFDYTALGANEIEEAFLNRAKRVGNLSIEQSIILYYPFPVVFYVNTNKAILAKRIAAGLNTIKQNGKFDALFNKHHGDVVSRLKLNKRKIFVLTNPALLDDMGDFKASLLEN